MCSIICIIQDITSSLFDLKPPFWRHHTHYIIHRVHCICVITPTLSQSLYVWYHISICETFCPLYLWYCTHYVWQHNPVSWLHHTRHMYDIICTTEDITSTLSHQATVFMTLHPLQAWHHNPCIRHHSSCIFVITTSPLKSHPLCMTSHPLYVWHHTHYI